MQCVNYYELEYMTKMLSERLKYIYTEFPMRLEIHEKYSTVDEQDKGQSVVYLAHSQAYEIDSYTPKYVTEHIRFLFPVSYVSSSGNPVKLATIPRSAQTTSYREE